MPVINRQKPTTRAATRTTSRLLPTAPSDGWGTPDITRMLAYGQPKTGKTTLASTFPEPLLWLICSGGGRPGELRSIDTPANRKRITPRVLRSTDQLKPLLEEEAPHYATVVLDHVSGLQDLDLKEVLGVDELPAVRSWGMAQQSQYAQTIRHCIEYVRALLSLPVNVVVLGQERTFGGGDESGDSEVIRPVVGVDVMPSFHRWLAPAFDYLVQAFKRPRMEEYASTVAGKKRTSLRRGRGVEYCLRIGEHETYLTGFRRPRELGPLPEVIVDPSYAKIRAVIAGEYQG